MHRQNWDDLRFVLAVAETGSVSEAARALSVTHATVLRRVAAFEERHGEPVFLRSARGYSVLPDKLAVLEAAQEVENAVMAVDRLLTGSTAALKGPVRITSTDSLCQSVLPGIVQDIAAAYPDLRLTLHSANRHLDFNRLAADITVRPAEQLEDTLIGIKAGVLTFALYGPTAAGRADEKWLTLEGPLSRSKPAEWMRHALRKSQFGVGSDSFMVQIGLIAAGAGQGFLPTFLADSNPGLSRKPDVAEISVPIWVASAADMAHTSKVKVVSEQLVDGIRRVLG
ncbi:LysR family transcriptional regulator [uncultured Litoreibacter sp.]|uniref:LysR family transcriptional regulator n=1 Tax=uncultured Litoreibacter sp. TaxID=1392394 RepID=UPI0026093A6B|nr:LysR family transcriptional regulator [uncultured Litoreibacter sp.]